ncbi:MAG: GIY-YIG nuclease family protein [Rickettsiales bacterium]
MKEYFVYIMAHEPHGVIYIGVTNDLIRRAYEHKHGLADGFTKKYNIKMLVYYEMTENIEASIRREKLLKRWKRQWKEQLIAKSNPEWKDLYSEVCGVDPALNAG